MTIAEALSMLMDTPAGDLQTTCEIRGERLILDPYGPTTRMILNPDRVEPVTAEDIMGMVQEEAIVTETLAQHHEEQGRFARLIGVAQMHGEDV